MSRLLFLTHSHSFLFFKLINDTTHRARALARSRTNGKR